jgi:hypothetical protein
MAKIQFRRDAAAAWASANPVLGSGEVGFESDTRKFKIGNGSTAWNSLSYVVAASNLTGTVAVANGGTGSATLAPNNVLLGNSTDPLQAVPPGAAGSVLTSNGTTWTSAASPYNTISSWSSTSVALTNAGVYSSSFSFPSGADVFIVVAYPISSTQSVTSVTFGGTAATLVGSQFLNNVSTGTTGRVHLYRVPAAGNGSTQTLSVTMNSATYVTVAVGGYTSVVSVGTAVTSYGSGTGPSIGPVSCPTNGTVLSVIAGGTTSGTISASTGGTQRSIGSGTFGLPLVVRESTADATFTATTASAPWAAVAVTIQTSASVSGGSSTANTGLTSTPTAAGTTTLAYTSTGNQVLTGTAAQTVRLPSASVTAGSTWTVFNQSTGLVTVQSSSAETVAVLGRGASASFTALAATPTTPANWAVVYNGRVPRVGSVTTSATPTINCDLYDQFNVTALATEIVGFTVTGTPSDGQKLLVRIKDNGTASRVTWGSSTFSYSGTAALLGTTVASRTHLSGFIYDAAAARWVCVGSDAAGY